MTIAILIVGLFSIFATSLVTTGFCAKACDDFPHLRPVAVMNLLAVIALFVLALVK